MAARWGFPAKKESDTFWHPAPLLIWTNIPNKRGFSRSQEVGEIPVVINSKGLRDVEYNYAKPEDVFRIFVLGDSFVQAFQVDAEDSFPKLLGAQLNERSSSAARFEVVNARVTGCGTDQELLFFRQEGCRYSPDPAMRAFCTINGVTDSSPKLDLRDLAYRKQFLVLNNGELGLRAFVSAEASPTDQHKSLREIIRPILKRSRLYQVVRRSLRGLTEGMTAATVETNEAQGSESHPAHSGAMVSMPIYYGIYAPQYTTA